MPYEVWWQTMVERSYPGVDGLFVHPVDDEAVMAGNGTIGLELCEQLAAFDAVVVPFGGGGLTTGIASAVKALRPDVRVYTAEPGTAAPLAASLAAGAPTEIAYAPSFVDGAGGRALLPGMWERARALVDERVRRSAGRRRRGACACSPSARGSSPRARARCPSPRRSRAARGSAGSCASSRAATSTGQSWPES